MSVITAIAAMDGVQWSVPCLAQYTVHYAPNRAPDNLITRKLSVHYGQKWSGGILWLHIMADIMAIFSLNMSCFYLKCEENVRYFAIVFTCACTKVISAQQTQVIGWYSLAAYGRNNGNILFSLSVWVLSVFVYLIRKLVINLLLDFGMTSLPR